MVFIFLGKQRSEIIIKNSIVFLINHSLVHILLSNPFFTLYLMKNTFHPIRRCVEDASNSDLWLLSMQFLLQYYTNSHNVIIISIPLLSCNAIINENNNTATLTKTFTIIVSILLSSLYWFQEIIIIIIHNYYSNFIVWNWNKITERN